MWSLKLESMGTNGHSSIKESTQIERFFENYFSVDGKVVPEKDPDSSEVH